MDGDGTPTDPQLRPRPRSMTTIGVLGTPWRGDVDARGTVQAWDGSWSLRWYVAADDRWHVPAEEPTVRQVLVGGTPVVETRVRVPGGDAVQRAYAVADGGGLTVVELRNDSPLPIAVALVGPPLLTSRPPADVPVRGLDLPAGTPVFPVGHRATVTVAVAHDGRGAGQVPAGLPEAEQVAAGWLRVAERAGRLVLPDEGLVERVVATRTQLLLHGPAPGEQPVACLLGIGQVVRMQGGASEWMPLLAEAVEALAPGRGGLGGAAWHPLLGAALDAAELVAARARERRALRDLARVRTALAPALVVGERHLREVEAAGSLGSATTPPPPVVTAPGGPAADVGAGVEVEVVARVERLLVHGTELLPVGIPPAWRGQALEVHGLPTGPSSAVSFALRWHGARPAVLWDCSGDVQTLTAPVVAPGWTSAGAAAGEALWPAPDV